MTAEDLTLEEMAQALDAAGWKKKAHCFWMSPEGRLYLGPYGAWKVMSRTGVSPEFTVTTVTERP